MNKTDLIKSMASRVGCTEVVARQMVEVLMEVMEEGLSDGNDIVLQGFDTFRPWKQTFHYQQDSMKNPRFCYGKKFTYPMCLLKIIIYFCALKH